MGKREAEREELERKESGGLERAFGGDNQAGLREQERERGWRTCVVV